MTLAVGLVEAGALREERAGGSVVRRRHEEGPEPRARVEEAEALVVRAYGRADMPRLLIPIIGETNNPKDIRQHPL